jgi:hypothetical protein
MGYSYVDISSSSYLIASRFVTCTSDRLDSPLIPVRDMAMRIALVFSTAMDPKNPLLFDENDNVEELLDWEGLESNAGQKSITSNNLEKQQSPAETKVDNDNADSIDQTIERRRRRKAKEEKLALEEDDPDEVVNLGAEASDDEADDGSESASDSDSSLKPYDMSDGDEDTSRGKFVTQLADLATNLRKGDKPDAVSFLIIVCTLKHAMKLSSSLNYLDDKSQIGKAMQIAELIVCNFIKYLAPFVLARTVVIPYMEIFAYNPSLEDPLTW